MLPRALDFARGLLGLLVLVGVVERVEIEIVQILHRLATRSFSSPSWIDPARVNGTGAMREPWLAGSACLASACLASDGAHDGASDDPSDGLASDGAHDGASDDPSDGLASEAADSSAVSSCRRVSLSAALSFA